MTTSNDLLKPAFIVLCLILGPVGWAVLGIASGAWLLKYSWEVLTRPRLSPAFIFCVVSVPAACFLVLFIVGSRVQTDGSMDYAALAEGMNGPELTGHVAFWTATRVGYALQCTIDREWRAWTPDDRRSFALGIANQWANLTGNPSAPVFFGNGYGTCFAVAFARSRIDGQPFYRPVDSLDGRSFAALGQ